MSNRARNSFTSRIVAILAVAAGVAAVPHAAQAQDWAHSVETVQRDGEARCRGGQPDACVFVGVVYERGAGDIAPDPARAEALYRVGCRAGSRLACENLGNLLADGRGGAADARAARFLSRACTGGRGDMRACVALAALEVNAHPTNDAFAARAHAVYVRACARGNQLACHFIGPHPLDAAPVASRALLPQSAYAVVFEAHAAETQRCSVGAPRGAVTEFAVGVTTDEAGDVQGVAVLDASVAAPAAEACVVRAVRQWHFPHAERRSVGLAIVRVGSTTGDASPAPSRIAAR